jgi:multiple sugar transport system permease protein
MSEARGVRRLFGGISAEQAWGMTMLVPYVVLFLALVAYPVGYGLWLGSSVADYARMFRDPAYFVALANTAAFLLLAVNLKMFLALLISGYFLRATAWVRFVSLMFLIPWAVPSFISILSFRWMLNAEWGMLNGLWFRLTTHDGPAWLLNRDTAMAWVIVVHIWKWLPFWTLIMLAGRLTIAKDLYEAAEVDGAGRLQQFVHITLPSIAHLYLVSTVLSTIWSLGDFNSVFLLTAGGPNDSTQVLATLGIRYAFATGQIGLGVATVISALPVLVPLVVVMLRWLRRADALA